MPLKNNSLRHSITFPRVPLRVLGYAAIFALVAVGASWAHLDQQVEKASNLVLSKVATLIVGGGALFGGGHALIQGNISRGMAILGTGALTGIGIALAKSGALFELLQ